MSYSSIALASVSSIRDSLKKNIGYCEMTLFEHEFLCGIVDKIRPNKIVELGVAAGVTSAVLLSFCESIKLFTKLYSIDISKEWYRDNNKETGFVCEEWKKNSTCSSDHIRFFGNGADSIESIMEDGEKIDLLLLDTMHILPGELLDYLAFKPFLAKNSFIVLHDINLSHLYNTDFNAYANRIIFDVAHGEKYYMKDCGNYENLANIGAIRLNNNDSQIDDGVFSSLYMPWTYLPDKTLISLYGNLYGKLYGDSVRAEFESIAKIQRVTHNIFEIKKHFGVDVNDLIHKLKKKERIYIYGCGYWGREYYFFARNNGLEIAGFVVSDDKPIIMNDRRCCDVTISRISEIKFNDNDGIVLAVSESNKKDCVTQIKKFNLIDKVVNLKMRKENHGNKEAGI